MDKFRAHEDEKAAKQREARRKHDAELFWPNDARAFAKKLAATHPDVWELIVSDYGGDKAKVLAVIDKALFSKKYRDGGPLFGTYTEGGPRQLVRAMIAAVPAMTARLELRAAAAEYESQRISIEPVDHAKLAAIDAWLDDEEAWSQAKATEEEFYTDDPEEGSESDKLAAIEAWLNDDEGWVLGW